MSPLPPSSEPASSSPPVLVLDGRVVLITGGAGLLGPEHAVAAAVAGARVVLVDIDPERLERAAAAVRARVPSAAVLARRADITRRAELEAVRADVEAAWGVVDVLVNNAGVNPTMAGPAASGSGMLEDYPIEAWDREVAVGLTGALLCIQVFGAPMAARGGGAIVNIASDLGVIAPDHRIYTPSRRMEDVTAFKPVSYPVVKTALIGLTRYVATYWAHRGVRCNAIAPGGVFNGQGETLVAGLLDRIPMGRMADRDEYHGVLVFLCSDASRYMTGQVLVVDGGRSVW